MHAKRSPTGIRVRHQRGCPAAPRGATAACRCSPSYEASVYDARASRKAGRVVLIRKTFSGIGALASAKAWRRDAAPMVARGEVTAQPRKRLEDAANEWLAKCEAGEVLSRRRTLYAAGTLRHYRGDLEKYIYPVIGHRAYQDVSADEVQAIVGKMNADGLAGQTVRNAVVSLAAFYRYVRRSVPVDPTSDLDLPEPGAKRDRAATVQEAQELLDALPEDEHTLYGAAFYAGLRRGELQALRVGDLTLDGDSPNISVARSWDQAVGAKEPKSKAGKRRIPIPKTLQAILAARVDGMDSGALVFGRSADKPFMPNTILRNAAKAWEAANKARAEAERPLLNPIGLHECRHTYATWLDDAGISEIRSARYLGHSLGSMTSRYTHQLANQLEEDGNRIEEYLTGAKGEGSGPRASGVLSG